MHGTPGVIAVPAVRSRWRSITRRRSRWLGSGRRSALQCRAVVAVPRISEFYGVVITMYFGDHPPPHFHAEYAGRTAKIGIGTGAVLAGSLPPRALALVREWEAQHRAALQDNWSRAERMEPVVPIPPLP
jgi:hypothetical protein